MLSRANFLKLDVYFASLKQELVAQQKAYGPLNFLSKCWILFFIIMHISQIQYREYSFIIAHIFDQRVLRIQVLQGKNTTYTISFVSSIYETVNSLLHINL